MEFYVGKNGTQAGPFSERQVVEMVRLGQVAPTDLIWRQGMAEWQPISVVLPSSSTVTTLPLGAPPIPPPTAWMSASQPLVRQPLASLGARLGAKVLDGLLFFLCCLPAYIGGLIAGDKNDTLTAAAGLLAMVAVLVFVAVQIYLLCTNGQTIGKKLIGIRIVKYPDGSNPGFIHAVLLRSFVVGLIGAIPFLGLIFTIIDVCCIFRENRRCLHDDIASTVVVTA